MVGSVKGAPGATTVGLGLAALWPQPGVVLVEADPAGGVLAARFGYACEPGLPSLAAAARTGAAGLPLGGHVQRLPVGADVVLAPAGDAAAASVHTLFYGSGVLTHAARAGTVLVDVGRLTRGGPGCHLAAAADRLLLVSGPGLD